MAEIEVSGWSSSREVTQVCSENVWVVWLPEDDGNFEAFQEWTNHRNAKSSRFANFVGEPKFYLNSPTFSTENLLIHKKNAFSKPFRP